MSVLMKHGSSPPLPDNVLQKVRTFSFPVSSDTEHHGRGGFWNCRGSPAGLKKSPTLAHRDSTGRPGPPAQGDSEGAHPGDAGRATPSQ